ncbi:cytochrome C, partial [Klebsiella pneumoniae]
MSISRRQLISGSASFAGVMMFGAPAVLGQGKPRVVVIGGGAGGVTAAKYIAKDSAGTISVTLVEPLAKY